MWELVGLAGRLVQPLLSVEGTVAKRLLGCGFVNADSRRRGWPQASVYKAASQ